MKKKLIALAVAVPCLASSFAHAVGPQPYSAFSQKHSKTRAYVGLNWTLGSSITPALVLGVMQARTKSNGDTTGANLTFSLDLLGGPKPGALKLTALGGKENAQGELGVGYHFGKAAPLFTLGVNAPHLALGIDGILGQGIAPYATLHSNRKFDKPSHGCLAGDVLVNATTCSSSVPEV